MMPVRYTLALLACLLFFVRPLNAQTLAVNVQNVRCHSGTDGAIDLSLTGGTGPFTFAWSNSTTQEDLTNLPAGTYTVTVTDGTGNTVTTSATVVEPAAMQILADVKNVRCFDEANGSITLAMNGGTAPYNFAWNTGSHAQNLAGLKAGTYTVTITDANGCTSTHTEIVQQPLALSWAAGTTTPDCAGSPTGAIDLQTLGGTAPFTYYWSDGAITEDRSALLPGTYNLTIVDAHNCLAPASFDMVSTQNMSMNLQTASPSCGSSNGTIDVASVSGGTAPYTYAWSNGNTTAQAHNLSTGTYTVTVTDVNGCSISASEDIGHILIYVFPIASNCSYNLGVQVSNGTAPYTFLWSNGVTVPQMNVPPGSYNLTVTDATGCTSVVTTTLAPLPNLVAGITLIDDACSGGLLARGYNFTGVSYQWSNGANTSKIENVTPGTYTVTVASVQGCTASATITTTETLSDADFNVLGTFTQPTCINPNGGAISLVNTTGSNPPLSFLWPNGSTTLSQTNLSAGAYIVTIADAVGCSTVLNGWLLEPLPPVISGPPTIPIGCVGSVIININVDAGSPPYTYQWSNGSNIQDIQVFSPGTYTVTVTGGNACTSTATFTVVQQGIPAITAINPISNNCGQATLEPVLTGNGPFAYAWSGPNNFNSTAQVITVTFSGAYTLTVTASNGCTAVFNYVLDVVNNGPCGSVEGKVMYDLNENCAIDAGEVVLSNWLVRAANVTDTLYGTTNVDGEYVINAPAGVYTLETIPPNDMWEACPGVDPVVIANTGTVQADDILMQGTVLCPALTVSISTPFLRRCFSNNYYTVQYCNTGPLPAQDAYVLVTLDPFLTPVWSSLAYADQGNGVLRFDVGNVGMGACGVFQLAVQVSCDAVLGQTHCTEAVIFPNGYCRPDDPAWSGASLRLTGHCETDSVRFTIKNAGVGDMQGASDYIVVEDAVMLMSAPFQLAAGESTDIVFPANGSTWRVEVEQVPFHPDLSRPVLSLEGCSTGAPVSTGFVNQFPNDEADPWVDVDCRMNAGAFDPNDKQGFPLGYGQEHYIRPGQEIEYMIRFQNTGTDTAFTVRIADTLSSWLDPASIRPGVSSHPYKFNLTGPGIAEFLFEHILLPDSNINEAASHGFVTFSIYPKAAAPLETLIENTAHIYFDFNDAVVTNTTRHRLGEDFVTVGLWQPERAEYEVLVSPNPFFETARLEIKGLTSTLPVHLQVIDLQGKIVCDETAPGPILTVGKKRLPAGMYLFKLDQKGRLIGTGKLIVRN